MIGKYPVTLGGQTVGTVELRGEGLYCRIFCRCRMVDQQIHRLYADEARIGVLIPENGELVLETRVAARKLNSGCVFSLDGTGEEWIPIRPGEAFLHLDKLRYGTLAFREGKPVLKLTAEPVT